MGIALITIPLLLVFSVCIVKVASSDWRLYQSGSPFNSLKRTYSEIQRFATDKMTKIGKESIEAARYVPSAKRKTQGEEQQGEQQQSVKDENMDDEYEKKVTEAMLRKRSLFKLPLSRKHQNQAQGDDGDMEGIVTGIHKIAFDSTI
ncbi:hypothetical protein BDB00DRAFT_816318 [Zychaea mexicana]|uniref:uncharacterized protein n=1 Tax=Zychaea mexicana TaxID=64656 RepID=UPI0022FF0B54|nr:uncharacterized protein BDB00DRAFT_816318 [Zychaea mexicana]KAI9494926.1 hypothetical protein BDB00DRAFT_816318 [Zychaea mexicana]